MTRLISNPSTSSAANWRSTAKLKASRDRTLRGSKTALNCSRILTSKYSPILSSSFIFHRRFAIETQVHEYKAGRDVIKSKMEIDPASQKDAGFYECVADNKYAIDKRGFRTDYTLEVY